MPHILMSSPCTYVPLNYRLKVIFWYCHLVWIETKCMPSLLFASAETDLNSKRPCFIYLVSISFVVWFPSSHGNNLIARYLFPSWSYIKDTQIDVLFIYIYLYMCLHVYIYTLLYSFYMVIYMMNCAWMCVFSLRHY